MIGKIGNNNLIQQSQFTEPEQTKPEESKVVQGAPVDQTKVVQQYVQVPKYGKGQETGGGTTEALLRSALESQLKVDIKPKEAETHKGPAVDQTTKLEQYVDQRYYPHVVDQNNLLQSALDDAIHDRSEGQQPVEGKHHPGVFEKNYRNSEPEFGGPIGQALVDLEDRDRRTAVTPDMLQVEKQKFTPAKLAAANAQPFTATREALLRSGLEGKLKVDVPQAGASETATPTQPKEDVGIEGSASSKGLSNIDKVLIPGSKGPEVALVQTELNKWRLQNGLDPISVTADYNTETEEAVKQFQEANGLKADGKFGPLTRDRMMLENDSGFQKLPDDTKAKARELMNNYSLPWPGDLKKEMQDARWMVINCTTWDKFIEASPDVQAQALNDIEVNVPHDGELGHHVKNHVTFESDPNFQRLDDPTKLDIERSFDKYWNLHRAGDTGRGAEDGLVSLATNPKFADLSETHREEVLDAYKNNPTWNNMTNLTATIETKGFSNADDTMKSRIIGMAKSHGKNDQDMMQLTLLLDSAVFNGMTPEQQNSTLDAYEAMHPNYDPDIVK